jgi:hypothetical protein
MTATTPDRFILGLEEPRRSHVPQLHRLIRDAAPELEPEVSGSMIGYGKYHYRYASGREGDWYRVTLAANKRSISMHVVAVEDGTYLAERRADRFPKASVGKSCVRFSTPEDLDLDALRELVRDGAEGPIRSEG